MQVETNEQVLLKHSLSAHVSCFVSSRLLFVNNAIKLLSSSKLVLFSIFYSNAGFNWRLVQVNNLHFAIRDFFF